MLCIDEIQEIIGKLVLLLLFQNLEFLLIYLQILFLN